MCISLEALHLSCRAPGQGVDAVVKKDKRMFLRVRPSVLAEIRAYGEKHDRMTARSVILSGLAALGIPVPEAARLGVRKMRTGAQDDSEQEDKECVSFSVLLPESVWRHLSLRAAREMKQKRTIILEGLSALGLKISDDMKADISRLEKE